MQKLPGVALSVQIMGNEPRLMAEAAAVVASAGADVVDVNLGCPTACAARKNVGAALLRQPAELRRLLIAIRGAVPGLFSAKLRAGFDTWEDALGHGKLVEECGADFLTVHPRRGIDKYCGVADWRIIALLRRELRLPVVGNGDVWYAQDALRMLEALGGGSGAAPAAALGSHGRRAARGTPAARGAAEGAVSIFDPCGAGPDGHSAAAPRPADV